MKEARPGGRSGNGPGESEITKQSISTPPDSLQIAPRDWPSAIELPVENLRRRPALHPSLLEH